MKVSISLFVLIVLAACSTQPKADPISLNAGHSASPWMLEDTLIYVGPQPTASDLKTLQAHKVTSIINLRPPAEMTWDEEAAATQLGLAYTNIPIIPATVTAEKIQDLKTRLSEADGPVFVHCSSGNRAAMMMALAEIYATGMSSEEAIAKARQHGLTKDFLAEVIKKNAPAQGAE